MNEISQKGVINARGQFRERARTLLQSAIGILNTEDDSQLDVVAMRLRKAFECLTYEYATIYLDELTDQDLTIWQPRKLMDRLVELDPIAGIDLELSIQNPDTGEWVSLGKQASLNVKDIRKSYGKLSRLMHHPSLQQLLDAQYENKADDRRACEAAAKRLERVLSSTLWNVALPTAGFLSFSCPSCQARVTRRLTALIEGPHDIAPSINADCPKCPASFTVELPSRDEAVWSENTIVVSCPNPDCSEQARVWQRQCREGEEIECAKCKEIATVKRVSVLARAPHRTVC